MNPPGPNDTAPVHPQDDNTLNMTTINEQFKGTLKQLWILIQQLEEINTQFALFLQMLPIPKPSMPNPSQPSEGSSNKLATATSPEPAHHCHDPCHS